ncbi:MAG: DUF4388 domain-containing protein [Chroococcidiopsidaceae cyanobacterium CP_BM_ER_R8_30]|nr:DUF4388 domain-containing protein [Chroococcidiopsidaceae cyanobacterium CP_BM_ER_R8_30]
MILTGHLSEFSLPEIFQFVEQGYKTGLLSLQFEPEAGKQPPPAQHYSIGSSSSSAPLHQIHHVWLQGGRIVAIANQRDQKGLLSLIHQRGWLSPQLLQHIRTWAGGEQPLGLYLKTRNVLTPEQLKLLFHAQVLQRVCTLFRSSNGQFKFDPKAPLPRAEMTGLSLLPTEATLLGLRVLQDWTPFAQKLPNPNFGLTRAITGKPHLQLHAQELQVWEFAGGSVTIATIAKQLHLSVEAVQQIAFRIMVVGLVEEVPVIVSKPNRKAPMTEIMPELVTSTSSTSLNQSFLHNLVGFLRSRV